MDPRLWEGNYSEISWKPPIRQKKQETLKISDDWNVEALFFHTILFQSNHWLDTNFKSSWWSHTTHTNQTTGSSEQKLSNSNHCVFFKLGPWEYQPFVCFVVSCVNLLILTLSIPKCYLQYECENYNTFMTWFYCNTQQSIFNYSTMLFLNKIIRINKSSSCSQRQNSQFSIFFHFTRNYTKLKPTFLINRWWPFPRFQGSEVASCPTATPQVLTIHGLIWGGL